MRVTVVGAGSWGTALAMVLVEGGHDVCLWSWEEEVADAINERSVNPYLEGVTLPEGLRADSDLATAVRSINTLERRLKQKVPELKWCFVEPDDSD